MSTTPSSSSSSPAPSVPPLKRLKPRSHCDSDIFGHVDPANNFIGKTWKMRRGLDASGVHPSIMQGIYGRQNEGAFSVVLSGGYEDDEDNGENFTYTGSGGRNKFLPSGKRARTGPQTMDQSFDHPKNASLQLSCKTGNPIRVVRGFKLMSIYAPAEGRYRYDGLYKITRAWTEKGRSGYIVCRYSFERLPNQPALPVLAYEQTLKHLRKSKPKSKRVKTDVSSNATQEPEATPSVAVSQDGNRPLPLPRSRPPAAPANLPLPRSPHAPAPTSLPLPRSQARPISQSSASAKASTSTSTLNSPPQTQFVPYPPADQKPIRFIMVAPPRYSPSQTQPDGGPSIKPEPVDASLPVVKPEPVEPDSSSLRGGSMVKPEPVDDSSRSLMTSTPTPAHSSRRYDGDEVKIEPQA
ncbi:hypothetical protein EIP91_004742 [Steccherinum ochraceum]|uniref:YDG domain-containing protein n=1 Tax=Steccherinum ochraceum TaxID=92696 RepID=A0A4R0R8X3_9APHY|nr:hypothetical protein EIP91_004742 [Steccherinum ochraceum]